MAVNELSSRLSAWLWPIIGLAACLSIGLVGDLILRRAWRSTRLAELRRTVAAVAELAASHPWKEPWESDVDWQRLEEKTGIDLVPLMGDRKEIAAIATGNVDWVLAPTGNWRATVTWPLVEHTAPAASKSIVAIRGTQLYDHGVIDRVWWTAWLCLSLLMAVAWYTQRRRQQAMASDWRIELEPWLERVAASETPLSGYGTRSRSLSLPRLYGEDPAFFERLNELADRVNSSSEQLAQMVDRLELIFGNLSEGVLAVDDQSRTLVVNAAFREQFNLGSDECSLRPFVEVVRVPRVIELVQHVQATQKSIEQTVEVGALSRFLRLLASPLPMGGEKNGVLLTAIDVSSSQRSELARREFIAGASHELKTPLSAIRAYTETVQSILAEDPDAANRFLDSILAQADRMDRLVNGMMQLARAESGTLKLKLTRIDLVGAIRPCLDAVQRIAETKGLQCNLVLPPEQLLVTADRDALQTIASNLLSNAVRYTDAGGRVEIEVRREGASVLMSVSDTGVGIPEADLDRVFERFFRVEKDRAQDTGGTGLGLAIVKQLTQVLDGSVKVSSRRGQGTRFEVRLPAVGFTQSSSKAGGDSALFRS